MISKRALMVVGAVLVLLGAGLFAWVGLGTYVAYQLAAALGGQVGPLDFVFWTYVVTASGSLLLGSLLLQRARRKR